MLILELLRAQVAECRVEPPRNARHAAALGRQSQASGADRFAADVLPIIRAIQATGAATLADLTNVLNLRGIRSASGGRWHVSAVRNLLARSEVLF